MWPVSKYLEKREFEENKLRELKDRFIELRKVEQSLIKVHELFLELTTSVMKQVSHKFVTFLKRNFVLKFLFRRMFQSDELKTLSAIQDQVWKPR